MYILGAKYVHLGAKMYI